MTAKRKAAEKPAEEPALAVSGEVVTQTPEQEPNTSVAPEEKTESDNSVAVMDGSAIIAGVSTDMLKKGLEMQTEQRKLIKDFVMSHLEDGVDFGKIHVVNKDKCPNQYNCKLDYHYSKAVLFKPGQEKLFSLFQITAKLEKDEETYQMLPDVHSLVAYKCIMYRGETIVGEGRGSATVGDNRRDVNATIKIAEKRARMDACLSLGFSEYFAQDLDDPDYKSAADDANRRAAAKADAIDMDDLGLIRREVGEPINDAERKKLFKMIMDVGYGQPDSMLDLLKANNIEDPKAMTSGQARDFMRKIRDGKYTPVAVRAAVQDTVVEVTDEQVTLPDDVDQRPPEERTAPVSTEATLVVDDDFRSNVLDLYSSLTLNNQGEMWFKKYATGKPFGKFDDFSDTDWRKAFDLIQDILNGRVIPESRYLKDSSEPSSPPPETVPRKPYKEEEPLDHEADDL